MPRLISLSELIDRSWEEYRASFVSLMSISGWLLIAGLLYIIALLLYPTADQIVLGANLSGSETAGVLLYIITQILVIPVIGLWSYTAIVRLMRGSIITGSLARAEREGWQRFFPVLIASILFGALIVAALVIGLGPGFGLAIVTTGRIDASWMVWLRNVLIIAGSVAGSVLFVRWFGVYQFAPLASATDDQHGTNAFVQSRKLVKGRFWAVLVRSLIPKILFLMLGTVVWWLVNSIVNVGLSLAGGLGLVTILRLGSLTDTMIRMVLFPMFVSPLLYLVDVNLYKSLKETL